MQIKEQHFKELFLSEYGRMYKAAYILLGDEDEAKDAVHDVFAKLWADTIPLKEESQRTFLMACVRNRCLNIIAHRQTQQEAIRLLTPEAVTSETYDEEIIEMAQKEIIKMDEKNAKRRNGISKKAQENEPIKVAIHDFLKGCEDPTTASAIAEKVEISTQKASALLRQMDVKVTDVKVKGKGTQKGYTLA